MLTSGSSLSARLEVVDARVVGVALDPRLQADAVAVRLHRPLARLEGPRLRRLAAARGRGLEHAPVVEDPRHVDDRARPLGHLQDQVPVLGALELGVEAADLLDQRAAQDAEVAGVHLRPHPLRRPVGLEEGPGVVAGGGRSCLRRCRRSRPRGWRRSPRRQREGVGMERVVVVEQGEELARGHRQGVVGGGDDAAVLGPALDPDARVARAARARASRRTCGSASRRRRGTAPSRRSSGPHRVAASPRARRPACS